MVKFLAFIVFILSLHEWAFAALCRQQFFISPARVGNDLQILLKEQNQTGPACDLVVKRAEYVEALQSLLVDLQPVSFCPVDAVAARVATFTWQLPQNLRSSGNLSLIVNGELRGTVNINHENINLSGGCR